MSLLVNSATMRGFVVFDFAPQYKEAVEKLKVNCARVAAFAC
jgi:hypothetical protein